MWQTSLPAPTPLWEFERDGKALGFVRVKAAPELVIGEISEIAKQNGVEAKDIGGFWYGPRDSNGDVGQRASPKDRVVYYFHGASLDAPSSERTMLKYSSIRWGSCCKFRTNVCTVQAIDVVADRLRPSRLRKHAFM